jgi:murein DD-endopeptidase MepM/ murein hydrolase activator NlpD
LKSKKRKTKFFTFLLIPDNERATKSIKVSASFLRFFFIFIVALAVLIITGAVSYWRWADVVIDYYDLRDENTQLKNALSKIENIETDLDRVKKMDQKLRSSLSGYVSIIEKNDKEGQNDALEQFDMQSDVQYDRSIYNSIPDIYPVNGFITREFDTKSLLSEAHVGIDIASTKGSPVKATADGIVIFSGWTYEDGYVIILQHKFNFFSFYKHNLRNLCTELEHVKKGQIIALVGDTGVISSGPHLHFEIWRGSEPVDPKLYLRTN